MYFERPWGLKENGYFLLVLKEVSEEIEREEFIEVFEDLEEMEETEGELLIGLLNDADEGEKANDALDDDDAGRKVDFRVFEGEPSEGSSRFKRPVDRRRDCMLVDEEEEVEGLTDGLNEVEEMEDEASRFERESCLLLLFGNDRDAGRRVRNEEFAAGFGTGL